MILRRLKMALALPPRAIPGRLGLAVLRRFWGTLEKFGDVAFGSHNMDGYVESDLNAVCRAVPIDLIEPHRAWIEPACERFFDHRFDLLGSGWVRVAHGIDCKGNDGVRYDAAPGIVADPDGRWLEGRINTANLRESRRIWKLVDPAYVPIDWQLDFKSGYRWREGGWSGDIAIAPHDGVDAKLPWELARMQHLTVLAWAHRLDGRDAPAREFRNQVLDFIATNPPRFGINWYCPMDVAIRAVNWVIAYGLFRAHGVTFDRPFEAVLDRSLRDHGRHIARHLEYYPEGRANHYFSDIAGLLFIAACLRSSRESDGWLALAMQELVSETAAQFNADGTNFEGSTCYHRLSLEIATYATALAAGLPPKQAERMYWGVDFPPRTRPRRKLQQTPVKILPSHAGILARAAMFIQHVTRPDGRIVQIGDNDSGRFVKPHPMFIPADRSQQGAFREDHLDCGGAVAAVAALSRKRALVEIADRSRLDAALVASLARSRRIAGDGDLDASSRVRIGTDDDFSMLTQAAGATVELAIPGGQLRDRLSLYGYPDFGLWIFRSHRLHLVVRCGPTSSPAAGGSHAHNDQLAIDLTVDGDPWVSDPGSYLYCPPIDRRNRWRSVTAHAAPQWPGREPNRLDIGAFRMKDKSRARCLYFGERGFAGEHIGFGAPVRRLIDLGDDVISLTDIGVPSAGTSSGPVRCSSREEARRYFAPAVPYSPAYGEIEAEVVQENITTCHEHSDRHAQLRARS